MGKLGSSFCITDLTSQCLSFNEELPERQQLKKLVSQGICLPLGFPRNHYTVVQ